MIKTSIVIPTLNAASLIGILIEKLQNQTIKPDEIIVIDSSSDDETVSIASSYPYVKTIIIPREEFNHGATRHKALMETIGDYICFLTQDAVPSNERYLSNLLAPFDCENVALCTGRQESKKDAYRFVQLVQSFNYSDKPNVRNIDDISSLGIKAFFASDVCSAYRRTAYLECGGFKEVNTNEDMLMAATFLKNGWSVAYVPDAEVLHSHNLSFKQQYERNKEIGLFLETHSSDLMGVNETKEGVRLVWDAGAQLAKERQFGELLRFGSDCLARFMGNRRGRSLAKRASDA